MTRHDLTPLTLALLLLVPACGPKDADPTGSSSGDDITATTDGATEPDPTTVGTIDPTSSAGTTVEGTSPGTTIEATDDATATTIASDPTGDCASTCAPSFECEPPIDPGGTAGEQGAGSGGPPPCDPGFECIDVGACGCEEFKCVPEAGTGSGTDSSTG